MALSLQLIRRVLWCAILVLGLSAIVSAQSGRAFMEGYVIGEHELVGIPGATVELTGDPDADTVRDVKLSATTDKDGKYSLTDIPHGPYTLRVSAPGYTTYEIPIYMLSDNQTRLHVRLNKVS
jgi:hypothetical protein